MRLQDYPSITKAAISMAYDNGVINRYRTLEEFLTELDADFPTETEDDMVVYDGWLNTLTEEDFETVCNGEYQEQRVIMRGAPAGLHEFLNDIFEALR